MLQIAASHCAVVSSLTSSSVSICCWMSTLLNCRLKSKPKKGTLKFNDADKNQQRWNKLQKQNQSDIKVHFCYSLDFCSKPHQNWIPWFSLPRMVQIQQKPQNNCDFHYRFTERFYRFGIFKIFNLSSLVLFLAIHFTICIREKKYFKKIFLMDRIVRHDSPLLLLECHFVVFHWKIPLLYA